MKNEAKWHCERCGGYAKNRKERRLHLKCPMPAKMRFERAVAFNDPEFCEMVRTHAEQGDPDAIKLWAQYDEAKADGTLYKKMIEEERQRQWALGCYQDGTPVWKCAVCGEPIEFRQDAILVGSEEPDRIFCQNHRAEAVELSKKIVEERQNAPENQQEGGEDASK